ncbi:PIN domain-containing protein [Methylopila henanensis]|uniref:PIN domain-containing protein n=1 Tax=Methylopila henanensis TaxID=873516 RepID=A0ABW4K161_9HYPH
MIGVDTNILARYFLEDDPVWTKRADRFLEEELTPEAPGYVNPLTLAELVWTVRKHPGYDRQGMARLIEGLLSFDRLVIGEADAVAAALESFRAGGAGFADHLIAELNSRAGAAPTVTIDRKARQRPPFKPLT